MRWLFALLTLLAAFGAVIQLPHLGDTVNLVLFVILTVQFVIYLGMTVMSWKEKE